MAAVSLGSSRELKRLCDHLTNHFRRMSRNSFGPRISRLLRRCCSSVGKVLSPISSIRAIGPSSAAIVEAQNLILLRKMFDLTHPGACVSSKPANMDERRALAVNFIIHLDIVDADLGHVSLSQAFIR